MATFVDTPENQLEREVRKGEEARLALKKLYVDRLRAIDAEREEIGRKLLMLGYPPDLKSYDNEP